MQMNLQALMKVLGLSLVAALALAQVPSPAAAQEGGQTTELSPKQVEYFIKASEAMEKEDFPTAVEYYQLAIKQGEANILYASLGRALFRKGECKEADASYVKALTAPAVPDPPRSQVNQKIDEYRIGLRVDCQGTLEVACEPEDIQIRIGDGARRPCSDFPIDLQPGTYPLVAFAYGRSIDREVQITGMETSSLELKIENPKGEGGGGGGKKGDSGALSTVSMITIGLGAAVLGTAAVLDLTALGSAVDDLEAAAGTPDEQARFDEASSLQGVVLGMYIAGAALAVTGAVLYFVSPEEPAPAVGSSAAPRLEGWFGPGSAGIQYRAPW